MKIKSYLTLLLAVLLLLPSVTSHAEGGKINISTVNFMWNKATLNNGGVQTIDQGELAEPHFTVYTGSLNEKGIPKNPLTKNVDYTFQFSNNDKTGVATLTITGIGKYDGTMIQNFNVKVREEVEEVENEITLKSKILLINGTFTLQPYSRWMSSMESNDKKASKSYYPLLGFTGRTDKAYKTLGVGGNWQYPVSKANKALNETLMNLSRFLYNVSNEDKVSFKSDNTKVFKVTFKNGVYQGKLKSPGLANLLVYNHGKLIYTIKIINNPKELRTKNDNSYFKDYGIKVKRKGKYLYLKFQLKNWNYDKKKFKSQIGIVYYLGKKEKHALISNGGTLKVKMNKNFSIKWMSLMSDIKLFESGYKYQYSEVFLELKGINVSIQKKNLGKLPKTWKSVKDKKVKKWMK